jgi:hypothetical protein
MFCVSGVGHNTEIVTRVSCGSADPP